MEESSGIRPVRSIGSRTIKIAFVMAAGEGRRFRPYSLEIPKPLVVVDGKSLLQRNIEALDQAFVLDVIHVVASYKSAQIRDAVARIEGVAAKVEIIEISPKHMKSGLLAGYAAAADYLADQEYFVCVLGDEYYDGSDHAGFARHVAELGQYSACCAIKRIDYPHKYLGNYAVDFDEACGQIRRVQEKPATITSDYYGLGLIAAHGALARLAHSRMHPTTRTNLFDLLNDLPESGQGPIFGHIFEGDYVNVNNRTDLYEARHRHRVANWQRFSKDVVIPAFNEAATIGHVVRDFRRVCDNVIVMDNQSPDETADKARAAGAIVYSEALKGYGDAIRKGLDRSKADLLLITEADGTFRAEDLEKILVFLQNCDAVIGSRTYWQYVEDGAHMPFTLRIGNILFGAIVTLLWWNRKSRFTDVGCTYRGLWRDSYLAIRPHLVEDGPAFSPEMMIELLNEWQRTIEIPIPYHARLGGESKYSGSFKKAALTARSMLRTIIAKRIRGWYDNVRGLVGDP
jgi:UDP-N-acetylglucosamine diphosphorylase / glucose-1-phosphate thymidylyltransferase / UDP-N-acetylgalactosamine diphosphorylase / glucosamine-1-phosphate N-acetyltransferase / galactosamine-1-phosphate N-acetyltransferase